MANNINNTIETINVRFFIDDEDEPDTSEVSEADWLEAGGAIQYERHTIFDNGVRQICLTKAI